MSLCACVCVHARVLVCARTCADVWMHLYACCLRPIADSREASRRGGALKVSPLRALATRTVASSPVWHTAPARACTLAHAWRARSGAHPCSVGRICAQFFAARPMHPLALRFDLFIFFYLFCLSSFYLIYLLPFPLVHTRAFAGRGGGGERGRIAQPGAAVLLWWSARDLVRCTRAGYPWLPTQGLMCIYRNATHVGIHFCTATRTRTQRSL